MKKKRKKSQTKGWFNVIHSKKESKKESKKMSEEYIFCAAIRFTESLFTGRHHGECLAKLKANSEQGFLTNDSRFVDRKEALKIATKAGQKINKYNPKDILLSEDERFFKG
ncbi:hypothetical protein LCGC14_0579790 [marine sediment metagenome]|uniref:Uncharacterized protein n=1 Tax=marine sediment metagenome TaxID=412755 RepID=A0A0F9S0B1_9ZZZZ